MNDGSGFRERLQLCNHLRQKRLFDRPNNRVVDAELMVDDAISESTNAVPVNLGKVVFEIVRKAVCRFANDFKVADHSIHRLAVLCKIVEAFIKSSKLCPAV